MRIPRVFMAVVTPESTNRNGVATPAKEIYAHVMEAQAGAIPLTGIHGKIKKLRRVSDNSEVRLTNYWNLKEYSQNQFFFLNNDTCDSYPLPDERDTVVEVTLDE